MPGLSLKMFIKLQLLLTIAVVCAGNMSLLAGESDELDFYLRGILAERQRIRSAQLHISGVQGKKGLDGQRELSEPFSVECAFDARRIRFDSTEVGWVAVQRATGRSKYARGNATRKYLRTPDSAATWIGDQNQLDIQKPDAKMMGRFLFFDVRSIGLYSWRGIHKGKALEDLLSDYQNVEAKKEIDDSDRDSVVLSLWAGTKMPVEHQRRYWIRPDEGFSVVRSQYRQRTKGADDWKVIEESNASWKQIQGVWLPVHCEMSKSSHKLNFDIKWGAINEPLNDEMFKWESFGAPKTVKVVDSTSGKFVVIRSPHEDEVRRPRQSTQPVVFIGVNIGIIMFVAGLYLRRRYLASKGARIAGCTETPPGCS